MIVVDSTVWIARLRRQETEAVRKLGYLVGRAPILVGDVVLMEVLQGARDERHAAQIEGDLRRYQIVRMLDDGLAVQTARNYRLLRRRGITVRKPIDMIIGTFCIRQQHLLLHDDRDFDPMRDHLGLHVF